MQIYLEVGKRWVFAGALDWPGWCRRGRDEAEALAALLAYRTRYRTALGRRARGLPDPRGVRALKVAERLPGDPTTDFGVPGKAPAFDARPLQAAELRRLTGLLEACWAAFDATAEAARGTTLRVGPRGGGRDVRKIVAHVLEADEAYLKALGGRARAREMRPAFVDALGARARGELPDRGPRGGARWTARYAIRRSAWHALDHAWEIQDRADGVI